MAVDETLLDSATKPDAAATLRLYRFRSPTVTFGYAQPVSDAINPVACERLGVECVRRITGGRALVHQHELTYSFAAPALASSVKSTYRRVTGAIRSALERLDVPVDPRVDSPRTGQGAAAPAHLPCLAVATGHEITSRGGDKLVASAMRFLRRGFLQHGSILWSIDRSFWRQVTLLGPEDAVPAVGIRDLGGTQLTENDLIDALSTAFSALVGSSAVETPLTSEESALASTLEEKYRSRAWTEERRVLESPLVDNSEAFW